MIAAEKQIKNERNIAMATSYDGYKLAKNLDYVVQPVNGVDKQTIFANIVHRLANYVTIDVYQDFGNKSLGRKAVKALDFMIQYTNIEEWTRDMQLFNEEKAEYIKRQNEEKEDSRIDSQVQHMFDSYGIILATNAWTFFISAHRNGIIFAESEQQARIKLHEKYDSEYGNDYVNHAYVRPVQKDTHYDVKTGIYEITQEETAK